MDLKEIIDTYLPALQQAESSIKQHVSDLCKMQEDELEYTDICKYLLGHPVGLLNDMFSTMSQIVIIKYQYAGVKFKDIFPTQRKTNLNASNPLSRHLLRNALKFQIIANHSYFDSLNEADSLYLASMYALLFSKNIDNNMFYVHGEEVTYQPITPTELMSLASNVMNELYTDNYIITDSSGKILELPKNYTYTRNKRFTRDDLINLIEAFDKKPTVNDLCQRVNVSIKEANNVEKLKGNTSPVLMRKYLRAYDLIDRVQICRRRRAKVCPT